MSFMYTNQGVPYKAPTHGHAWALYKLLREKGFSAAQPKHQTGWDDHGDYYVVRADVEARDVYEDWYKRI